MPWYWLISWWSAQIHFTRFNVCYIEQLFAYFTFLDFFVRTLAYTTICALYGLTLTLCVFSIHITGLGKVRERNNACRTNNRESFKGYRIVPIRVIQVKKNRRVKVTLELSKPTLKAQWIWWHLLLQQTFVGLCRTWKRSFKWILRWFTHIIDNQKMLVNNTV